MPISSPSAVPAVQLIAAAATLTRPADTTAYASGDLVANSTTAGSVTPLSFDVSGRGQGLVRRARLKKSNTTVTNASFRLHLYSASPAVTNGDNGAWLSTLSASYLGFLDITVDKVMSDGSVGHGVPGVGTEIVFGPGVATLYGLLEARAAYTPTNAGTFNLALEILS